ncbi:DUF2946 family protein [Hylemonella sp. W303a]|uniref:DUF2946 family protein n=1 Tax=Hylemonella sp. W303a TaxID=3389873 RepID=UPI00396AF0FC
MERMRRLTSLARWTAVWVTLSVVLSVVTPLLKPAGLNMVCTATGGMSLVDDDGENGSTVSHCPMCCQAAAPAPSWAVLPAPIASLAYALTPARAAVLAYLTAPPLPSRGPPLIS